MEIKHSQVTKYLSISILLIVNGILTISFILISITLTNIKGESKQHWEEGNKEIYLLMRCTKNKGILHRRAQH